MKKSFIFASFLVLLIGKSALAVEQNNAPDTRNAIYARALCDALRAGDSHNDAEKKANRALASYLVTRYGTEAAMSAVVAMRSENFSALEQSAKQLCPDLMGAN